jgi:hypothetical protein
MKNDVQINTYERINLADRYRPIALGAVRAACSVGPVKAPGNSKKDASERFLLPENLPD